MSKTIAIDLKRVDPDLIGVETLLGLIILVTLLGGLLGGLFR